MLDDFSIILEIKGYERLFEYLNVELFLQKTGGCGFLFLHIIEGKI